MSLSNIYFILVRPQIGENIGSVARAIKNFNIKFLRIVNPRCSWPNQKALATSVGAKDVLKSTKIYDSVEKSIEDLKSAKIIKGEIDDEISNLNDSVTEAFKNNNAFAALKEDGSVVTWGSTANGGDSSDVSSFLNSNVSEISFNKYSFAAFLIS